MEMFVFIDSVKWLTIYEAVLCVIDLIILIRYVVPVQRRVRWLDYAPGAGVLIAIASYVHGDATLPALVLYALTLIFFLCTVRQIWRPTFPDPEKELRQTIQMLQDQKAKGLIIDLRNNPGGEDELAAKMAGYFTSSEKHFEHVSYYNRYTKAFELNQQETIRVKPSEYIYRQNSCSD